MGQLHSSPYKPLSAIERQLVGSLGLEQDKLLAVKETFLTVNAERLKRAQDVLSERQRQLLLSLPSLLDCNHPMLPGYISRHTPSGIVDFSPNSTTLGFIRTLSKSFQDDKHKERKDILGLFLMGSVGTIAHSETSDVDIWVCIDPALTSEQISELQLKCEAIEHWAQDFQLEIHFFLMDWRRHLNGEQSEVDDESSGSTQYYLLLDEFYRSAIHLAGCLPIWLFVDSKESARYDLSKRTIQERNLLKHTALIDLGNVDVIPPQEFLTAAIWQLYKAIESPYKSILKLLLLEAYTGGTSQDTLSNQFKRQLYSSVDSGSQPNIDELDPYLQAYYIIEKHLLEKNQQGRLDLVRRCFYFKVNKPLSKPKTGRKKSWQRNLLEKLVANWGWSKAVLVKLDNRENWKAPEVNQERKRLIDEMNRSYQLIVSFWKQHNMDLEGNNKDLNLLGRKLQAAFGRKSGKIDIVNPGISNDLTENKLFFTKNSEDRLRPWVVYSQQNTPEKQKIIAKKSLSEAISWCYYNNIVSTKTQCYCDEVPVTSITEIVRLLHSKMPVNTENDSRTFEKQPHITKIALLVHSDQDQEKLLHTVSKLNGFFDALQFGGNKQPLIRQIDCVYTNSWNEIYCQSFKSNSITQALNLLLRSLQENPALEHFIHCVNSNYKPQIEQQLHRLIDTLVKRWNQSKDKEHSRTIVDIYGIHHTIEFNEKRPIIHSHEDNDQLIDYLGQPRQRFIQTHVDTHTLAKHPLKKFVVHNRENSIQVFFEQIKNSAIVYLFDEKGAFVRDSIRQFSYPHSLQLLHHFLRNATAQYVIDKGPLGITPIQFYELHQKDKEYGYKESVISSSVDLDTLVNLSAACEVVNNELVFTVTIDEQELVEESSEDDEQEPLTEIAAVILAKQSREQLKGFAITSLDLSNCRYYLAENGQLFASHYLHIKALLEKRIRNAINQIKRSHLN